MAKLRGSTPSSTLSLFNAYVEIVTSHQSKSGGEEASVMEQRMARVAELIQEALARFDQYENYPQVRLPADLADADEAQVELVVMHENARLRFKQSLDRLGNELSAMGSMISVPASDKRSGSANAALANQLNFINEVEAFDAGKKLLMEMYSGLRPPPPRFDEVVAIHSRKLAESWVNRG